MKDNNCAYCTQGDLLDKFGYPVGKMDSGYLYIFKEQTKMGRVILAYEDHVSEIVDISDEERNRFFFDANKIAKAIHKIFSPSKVNYGMYGDTSCHLHMHIVPKYKGGDEWDSTFTMNPDKKYLSENDYEEIAKILRRELNISK
ncbi:HIT family protein [Lachnoanaerobaculum umeaense]|uniref:HIT family protein n=1 Tax=Lachnoanaerobaculum umeaense TaxID=617123 RepID=A0A385PZL1_9FIRM|nr:HIT family protein [Lachnoanaerobaculum umeaense]AYA99611.1 HIT family protein [Lachnoanaerobaculum umeaense]PZW96450.1 diadenosine tetraphosphate (Ap4A) HIT family hydrolase [Lachnoanaerobaculum umeaense]